MSDVDTDLTAASDELTALKARADLLKISYHPSIGVEKLREKIAAAMTSDDKAEGAGNASANGDDPDGLSRAEQQKRASELVRIRVTCMNPAKKEWDGEIFTVGNTVVGTFKKYVPFNADEGWHVPRIIFEQLKARECQIFVTVKGLRGNTTRQGKVIKEFAIEELPPLTKDELQELAQRQAMSKSVG